MKKKYDEREHCICIYNLILSTLSTVKTLSILSILPTTVVDEMMDNGPLLQKRTRTMDRKRELRGDCDNDFNVYIYMYFSS